MTATLHTLPSRGSPDGPALHLVGTAEADELTMTASMLMACAPPRLDRLEVTPGVIKREGHPWMPVVIVADRGLDLIGSADFMRRIAVAIDAAGRQGAALDLMQGADQAETLASHMQRGMN